ncbi:hypothetical protein JMJ55_02285 [Belnapia sp. T6]|uniref:Peroxidase n=1 Tax=Belnapia mucosa TaxID=2804532 RepID=A0ABS1V1G5_9PROT|nr:peroxidase family protein [Belnapia mucosa]MBL6454133.1 hypothetical protein [Belnapia mucosa]
MLYRSIDGSGNNLSNTEMNATGTDYVRIGPANFADGVSIPVEGPNPRTISNLVVGEGDAVGPNSLGLSGMMYAWGQFIDHDITLAGTGKTPFNIVVPAGDPIFADGTVIAMNRSKSDPESGTGTDNPSIAMNTNTGWLDGSMVYGSDAVTAAALRLADGHLASSAGGNLPIVNGNYLAGDVRAMENPSLTALQTIFLREHNWQVDRLAAADPTLTGDELYLQAKAIVTAEIAHITYSEFLPHLLGSDALPGYAGYDPTVDARLSIEFTGAAYRFGHSIVSAETERVDEQGNVTGPELQLRDTFFLNPAGFELGGGADGFIRHLGDDASQEMDARIVEDLRNFLFDPPVGLDLAAINIQRGRDLGLGTLNQTRVALGLEAYTDFAQITDDQGTVAAMRLAFASVDEVDLWTGGLAEAHAPGAFVGETFARIIADQFVALRDGDRFWYANQGFDADTLAMIEHTTLSDIVLRTTDTQYIQPDLFLFYDRLAPGVVPDEEGAPVLVVGGAADEVLTGSDGDDILAGGAGADTMAGGRGNDTYYVDDSRDIVDEGNMPEYAYLGSDGKDSIISTANWYWDIYSVAERLVIADGAADSNGAGTTAIGSCFDNEMIGNSGNNILFGRGGSDTYRAGDGVDYISLSTLGMQDAPGYVADGANVIIVDPRKSGAFSYDVIFEFDVTKDKIDISAYHYASAEDVLTRGVDDGAGNSYFILGDGLDYVFLVGVEKSAVKEEDFIV